MPLACDIDDRRSGSTHEAVAAVIGQQSGSCEPCASIVKMLEDASCPSASLAEHSEMQAINIHRKHSGIQRARERVTVECNENICGIILIQASFLK